MALPVRRRCSPGLLRPGPRSRARDYTGGARAQERGTTPNRESLSLPVVFERFAAARMAQLAQRLGFDLTDALARHAELLADLFKGALVAIFQAEAQHEHFALALGEVLQDVAHLLFEHRHRRRFGRGHRVRILDEVTEVAVFLFADRRLEGD